MARIIAALLFGCMTAGPAAADDLSPAADRLLWCSSAMYWLAADAFDAGEDDEGTQYAAWSDDLAARADLMLEAEGRNDAEVKSIRDGYDSRVLGEMGTDAAKYDVTACPELAAVGGD